MIKEYFYPYRGVQTLEFKGNSFTFKTASFNDNITEYFKSTKEFLDKFGYLLDISNFHKKELESLTLKDAQDYLLYLENNSSNYDKQKLFRKIEVELVKDLEDFVYSKIPISPDNVYAIEAESSYDKRTIYRTGDELVYLLLHLSYDNETLYVIGHTINMLYNSKLNTTSRFYETDEDYIIETKSEFTKYSMYGDGDVIEGPLSVTFKLNKEMITDVY